MTRLLLLFFLLIISFTFGQTHYIHDQKASVKVGFYKAGMVLIRLKKIGKKSFEKSRYKTKAARIPKSLRKHCKVETQERDGRNLWIVSPKENASEKVVFYLHGGGYVNNILRFHWKLVEEVVMQSNATFIIPDYPLGGEGSFEDTYQFVEAIYDEMLDTTEAKNISFMGDSAGGGLALGFAQKLHQDQKDQPGQLILMAPWVDVMATDPKMKEIDPKDKMLAISSLQNAGKAYADGADRTDYRISPIYGELNGLGKISVFIGTHDLLYADALQLKQKMAEQQIPLNFYEYPKMFHVWVAVTKLKESKHAIGQIVSLIEEE